jgi:hypothetical protein
MAIEGSTEPLIVGRRVVQLSLPGLDGVVGLSCREEGLEKWRWDIKEDENHKAMVIARLWLSGVNGREIHRALGLGIAYSP